MDTTRPSHGHLLALGYEEENLFPTLRSPNGAINFFMERNIQWHRTSRSRDSKNQSGPTRNMASSQVACVNFFLPLANYPDVLASIFKVIDSDVNKIVSIQRGALNSHVEFEWNGMTETLEGGCVIPAGAFATSADALIVADIKNDARRAYLIEWKYLENYISAKSKATGTSGQTRINRYSNLYALGDSSFLQEIPMTELFYEPFYQLMRLRLLADKMVRNKEFGITSAKVVVVCPEENLDYRNTITSPELSIRYPATHVIKDTFARTLKNPAGISMVSPKQLITGIHNQLDIIDWVTYYNERYET